MKVYLLMKSVPHLSDKVERVYEDKQEALEAGLTTFGDTTVYHVVEHCLKTGNKVNVKGTELEGLFSS